MAFTILLSDNFDVDRRLALPLFAWLDGGAIALLFS